MAYSNDQPSIGLHMRNLCLENIGTVDVLLPVTANDDLDLLTNCIKSVLSQSYSQFKLYILISGKIDEQLESFTDFIKSDASVANVFRVDDIISAASARNRLIRESESNIKAFIDSDDYWLPNHLEEYFRITENFHGSLFYHTSYFFGNFSKHCLFEYDQHSLNEIMRGPVLMSSVIVRNLDVEFSEIPGEDFLYALRCIETANKTLYGTVPTVYYNTERHKKKSLIFKLWRVFLLKHEISGSIVKSCYLTGKFIFYRLMRPF